MNEIARIEPAEDAPARRSPMMAGGRPMAIVPNSMEECYRLATAVCKAGMAPPGLDTPEKAMIAIMHGLEIGLTPMAALQRIAVVNGRPTIWGDGAMSLVRASGTCEFVNETIEGEGDKRVAVCEAMRRGERTTIRRTFSVDDAKRAGLWDAREVVKRKNRQTNEWYDAKNDAPWHRYPDRMLAMRARAFCLRDGFADVLGGLYLKEELDNDGDAGSAPAQQQRRAPSPPAAPQIEARPAEPAPDAGEPYPMTLGAERAIALGNRSMMQPKAEASAHPPRKAPSPGPAPVSQPKPAEAVQRAPHAAHYDPEKVRAKLGEALKSATDQDGINDAWMHVVDPWDGEIMPPDRDDFARMCSIRQAEVDGQEGATP